MGTNTGSIMTLANSIIGVSVLAMPFCFKQCGIVLSILMLIGSSLLSRLACHFLLKSAVMARRRTFEFLAFHTFGLTGKFTVELFIIGFLMGTCIAFFVVMGDLGPAIVAKVTGVSNSSALRPSVLIGLGVFVVLPLGMLRNVDSLSSVSMATIGFYSCLVLKVVGEALPHLLAGDWYEHVHFWRPAGIMQCIPIFSMALFCQTQLFEIYESMHNASLDRMNYVIRAACNICTGVYICVGFFGYIAFCTQSFTGNILMSFTPSTVSEMIKLGFVLSVAVSFPLVIFPCRASLYSLLFRRVTMPHHEGVSSHIPEARFKCLTVFIISVSLVIGLLIPNIELVLGLVGSTIGVLICVMFPAAAFICMSTKSSTDRLIAQSLLFVGALILVLGTYATLDSANVKTEVQRDIPNVNLNSLPHFHEKVENNVADMPSKDEDKKLVSPEAVIVGDSLKEKKPPAVADLNPQPKLESEVVKADAAKADARQEPPVPVEPAGDAKEVPSAPSPPKEKSAVVQEAGKTVNRKDKELPAEEPKANEPPTPEKKDEKLLVVETVDQDAIKKEDEELAEAEKGKKQSVDSKNDEILRKLEKHEEQQMKILEEQKQILQALQEHQEREERERKMEQQPLQPEQQLVEQPSVGQKQIQQPVQQQPIHVLPAKQERVKPLPAPQQPIKSVPAPQQPIESVPVPQQPIESVPAPQQPIQSVPAPEQPIQQQSQQQPIKYKKHLEPQLQPLPLLQQQQQQVQEHVPLKPLTQQETPNSLMQNQEDTYNAGKANEMKGLLPLIPDKVIARNMPDNAVNDVEKPLKQKSDLLQQIANGELKKPALLNPPIGLEGPREKHVQQPLPEPASSSNVISEKEQHLPAADFQPKIEPPAMPVQTVLLERMKGQSNLADPLNKSPVQPPASLALKTAEQKPDERLDEIKAVRREILQEPVASTLNILGSTDPRKPPVLNSLSKQIEELSHERGKRDIEEETGIVSLHPSDSSVPPASESQGRILKNIADPNEQNCPITDHSKNELHSQDETVAEFKVISNDIEESATNKMANTVMFDAKTKDINENKKSMINAPDVALPTSASDTVILNEKPGISEVHQDISSNGGKNGAEVAFQAPPAVPSVIPVPKDPESNRNEETQKSEDLLIKATVHLSNPKLETDPDKTDILRQERLPVGSEVKPMKRDLKSIHTSDEKSENSHKRVKEM